MKGIEKNWIPACAGMTRDLRSWVRIWLWSLGALAAGTIAIVALDKDRVELWVAYGLLTVWCIWKAERV
jgi:hypothetical protein